MESPSPINKVASKLAKQNPSNPTQNPSQSRLGGNENSGTEKEEIIININD